MTARNVTERPWERKRYRAPHADRSLYTVPALTQAETLLAANQQIFADAQAINIQGRRFQVLRDWARQAAGEAALAYTSQWCHFPLRFKFLAPTGQQGTDLAELLGAPWILTGHQPALFHPGVWVKNFAAGGIARQVRGCGLNLVVDNDTVSSTAVRVPTGSRAEPLRTMVPFDAPRPQQPWEEAQSLDAETFRTFPARVAELMQPWGIEPFVEQFWPTVLERSATGASLSACFTAARNQWERKWGLENLELPISQLCQLDPFLWFASHIFAQLPKFRDIYNQVLAEYRQVNQIRSTAHPVPELQQEDDWLEAPFWVWRADDVRRGRVFARQVGREVWLRDQREVFAKLPLAPDQEACCAVEVLRSLEGAGWRLRTRALTTTLFARLFLSDLFIHGIGGSKYDEMTDRICARFYGISPPAFLTVSATLQLPLGAWPVQLSEAVRLKELIRDTSWNPERHLPQPLPFELEPVVRGWREHLAAPAASDPIARMEQHHQLRQLKKQLAEATAPQRAAAQQELQLVEGQLHANRILRDREYAFCLYPTQQLQGFFGQFVGS